ncbi:F-box only protein 15 [Electrophorus electricus]|uniref:Zgc:161973 n=1 Tax=Electrophorus electricus TaxID=8005 RepID=A0A4W4GZC5_ELEEL|nr:F-box only protein 15 [Electrophorus electricus]
MATGRGQFFRSLRQGLEKAQPGTCGEASVGAKKGKSVHSPRTTRRKAKSSKPTFLAAHLPPTANASAASLCSHENYIERLPPEVILKIFSYLDAASLFCVGFVNRQFHDLANDNAVWYELYSREIARKKCRPKLAIMTDFLTTTQDISSGFWKRLLFREMGYHKDTFWKKELRYINPYTGMPAQTEQVLRSLRVGWEITLTHKGGMSVYEQSQAFFTDSSVTVCWCDGVWPKIKDLSSLQLHGVVRQAGGAPEHKPRWRSLISKMEVHRDDKWKFFGSDRLVKLVPLDKGITLGIWKGTWIIAFIVANLHFHKIVERSLLGSPFCTYRPMEISPLYDDMDPDYTFQGYTAIILLHNSVRRIIHLRYSPLLYGRDNIRGGFVQFRPINIANLSEHTPVSGKISFPWKTDRLQGDIKNCCMMTLTILDEALRPFWCVSSPVTLLLVRCPLMEESYSSEQFLMRYCDAKGEVKMNFVWMQGLQQYFLIGTQIRISMDKLSKHFRERESRGY